MNNSRIYKRVRIVAFLVGLMIMAYFYLFNDEIIKENYLKESYSGRIIRKFIDKKDHGIFKVELNDGTEVKFPFMVESLYESIEVGDSLYKNEYDNKGHLFKKGEIIIIDYPQ